MNKLIENIWKIYHSEKVPKEVEQEILAKAHESFRKSKGRFKLSTFISWWARQRATRK